MREYRERAARKSDLERADLSKEKTGVFTGAYAINPVNNEKIPIWIADYVRLATGPARSWRAGARRTRPGIREEFDLPIVVVVLPAKDEPDLDSPAKGSPSTPDHQWPTDAEAKEKITAGWRTRGRQTGHQLQTARLAFLPSTLLGRAVPDCLAERESSRVEEKELPVVPPPLDDFKPTGTGEPPLAKAKIGFVTPIRRCARRIPCRSGPAHAGITCASAIRTMRAIRWRRDGTLLDGWR